MYVYDLCKYICELHKVKERMANTMTTMTTTIEEEKYEFDDMMDVLVPMLCVFNLRSI